MSLLYLHHATPTSPFSNSRVSHITLEFTNPSSIVIIVTHTPHNMTTLLNPGVLFNMSMC